MGDLFCCIAFDLPKSIKSLGVYIIVLLIKSLSISLPSALAESGASGSEDRGKTHPLPGDVCGENESVKQRPAKQRNAWPPWETRVQCGVRTSLSSSCIWSPRLIPVLSTIGFVNSFFVYSCFVYFSNLCFPWDSSVTRGSWRRSWGHCWGSCKLGQGLWGVNWREGQSLSESSLMIPESIGHGWKGCVCATFAAAFSLILNPTLLDVPSVYANFIVPVYQLWLVWYPTVGTHRLKILDHTHPS